MKIYFNIDYHTNSGESVYIAGSLPTLGGGDTNRAIRMYTDDDQSWHCVIEIDKIPSKFDYCYLIRTDHGIVRREYGSPHSFRSSRGVNTYVLFDHWQDRPTDKPLYSSAFVDCIFRRPTKSKPISVKNGCITISVNAPNVQPDQVLALVGDNNQTGNWDTANAIIMNDADFPLWKVNLDITDFGDPIQYKFIILNTASHDVIEWEDGNNRTLTLKADQHDAIAINGLTYRKRQSSWRGAGVAIPVFSIRSNDDFGVGDFMDLKLMVDWAAATGQQFLQLLPINDTSMTGTWTDSYPYNANSTVALHPMYLRLQAMGTLLDPKRKAHYTKLGNKLNKLSYVDYEQVNNGKKAYTRELFAQDGISTLSSTDFKTFVKHNLKWLMPYAAFCVLRDRFHTADFSKWDDFAVYSAPKVAKFAAAVPDEINYIYFIQYHLDKQLREVREYAHEKGVAIKGDIPIGISRTSVDAWMYPDLFNINSQAGAPPDDFSILGQNWGFPTYNWEVMSLDGYAWWKARLRKMSEYFDAFRIDHILGFFRIWQIPMEAIHGLLGVFYPALPFSTDELKQVYDFSLDVDLHTLPYITDDLLNDLCPNIANDIRSSFLIADGNGRYHLKSGFTTQRQIVNYFDALEKSDSNNYLCETLLKLVDDVLFIEDPKVNGMFHPRISAQRTYIYRSLSDSDRQRFDLLYNDFFYNRHNDFWHDNAMQKLPPLVDATDMLVCAEDLGMIPACVPDVINRLDILSLEIQRMPKDPWSEFGDPAHYPYLSVCTTSTHDMGGIRQWWEDDHDKAQCFYNNILHECGDAPGSAEPWICDRIVTQHLLSPAMLTILPIQDWLSIDGAIRRNNPREEQINDPSNPHHYWRYRLHIPIEDIIANHEFCTYIHDKITECGR